MWQLSAETAASCEGGTHVLLLLRGSCAWAVQ